MSQQLEAILRRSGTLSIEELKLSVVQAHARNVPLWDIVVGERHISEDALAEALSKSLNVPRVRFDSIRIEAAAVKTVSGRIARQYTCLPVRLDGKALILAMANPLNRQAIQDVQFMSGRHVQPVVAVRTEILNGIEAHYPFVEEPAPEPKTPDEYETFALGSGEDVLDLDDVVSMPSIESGPAVVAYRQMILDALKWQASDIHVEPGPHDMRVRLRERELHALIRADRTPEDDALAGIARGALDEPASVTQRLRRDEDPLRVPRIDDVAKAHALGADERALLEVETIDEELGRVVIEHRLDGPDRDLLRGDRGFQIDEEDREALCLVLE